MYPVPAHFPHIATQTSSGFARLEPDILLDMHNQPSGKSIGKDPVTWLYPLGRTVPTPAGLRCGLGRKVRRYGKELQMNRLIFGHYGMFNLRVGVCQSGPTEQRADFYGLGSKENSPGR